ncbi:hypothetical protein B0O99DRAFT_145305 [Bisporella sp. PMI_857]|nr:hypothetical protein B0O99DRAFT_145305 [Bisporella sp. PMI_857]
MFVISPGAGKVYLITVTTGDWLASCRDLFQHKHSWNQSNKPAFRTNHLLHIALFFLTRQFGTQLRYGLIDSIDQAILSSIIAESYPRSPRELLGSWTRSPIIRYDSFIHYPAQSRSLALGYFEFRMLPPLGRAHSHLLGLCSSLNHLSLENQEFQQGKRASFLMRISSPAIAIFLFGSSIMNTGFLFLNEHLRTWLGC